VVSIANKEKRKKIFEVEDFKYSVTSAREKLLLEDAIKKRGNGVFGGGRGNATEYTQSEVRNLIKTYKKEKSQDKLREISEALYVQSPQYNRLINYYAGMPTYSYAIIPKVSIEGIKEEDIKDDFYKLAQNLSDFHIKSNFTKILRHAMMSDIFFGYVYRTDSHFTIQQLPNEICRITSIQEDVYNFSIDLAYFESNEELLEIYPREIEKAYKTYINLKKNTRGREKPSNWYELSAENTICIKINEGIVEAIPPFVGVFDSIFDINSFKDLRNDKAELENYKLILQKIPLRKTTVDNNDFLIDLNMIDYFYNGISDVIPSNIGLATTPMDTEVVTFDRDTADRDGVAKANKDFWDSSGTTQNLFSSDNKTSQGINKSIETDEQVVYVILNQFGRWINRYIELNNLSKYFKCVMIDATHFNKNEVVKQSIENSQYGFPMRMFLGSLLGIEPIAFAGLAYLENDILKLNDYMTPLKSSFNTSGKDIEANRPTNESKGLEVSDETERAKDKPDHTE